MTWRGLIQRYRRWKLSLRGVHVEQSCHVDDLISVGLWPRVHPPGSIVVGPECHISRGVELNPWGGRIRLGRRVFVGPYVVIYGTGGVDIGDHTLIAMQCSIISSSHSVPGSAAIIRDAPDIKMPTSIGRDCWIGAGTRILGGVQIADGCVVGAGAVVTKNLPPYSVAVGVPAKVVRYRR